MNQTCPPLSRPSASSRLSSSPTLRLRLEVRSPIRKTMKLALSLSLTCVRFERLCLTLEWSRGMEKILYEPSLSSLVWQSWPEVQRRRRDWPYHDDEVSSETEKWMEERTATTVGRLKTQRELTPLDLTSGPAPISMDLSDFLLMRPLSIPSFRILNQGFRHPFGSFESLGVERWMMSHFVDLSIALPPTALAL